MLFNLVVVFVMWRIWRWTNFLFRHFETCHHPVLLRL